MLFFPQPTLGPPMTTKTKLFGLDHVIANTHSLSEIIAHILNIAIENIEEPYREKQGLTPLSQYSMCRSEEINFLRLPRKSSKVPLVVVSLIVTVAGFYAYKELSLSSDERIARAEKQFQQEKAELEEAHRQEIKEAQNQVKLAEIESKRLALYNDSAKNGEHTQELEKAKAKLKTIKAQGVDYSALSKGKEAPSAPIDDQTKLILSGLWLGACFFLQRMFEKLFKDKGYAILTVCALGFLLAFFTANS